MDVILHMRNGGLYVTKTSRDSDEVASLGERMVAGGFAVFADSLWGRRRQLVVNLADVSSIEMIDEVETSGV